jgi:sulfur carrier protein ThiS
MADVVIPIEVARSFCEGKTDHRVDANNIRDLVKELSTLYPGIDARLNQGLAVAIDGEIFQDWLLEEVAPSSQVNFIPAIEGG